MNNNETLLNILDIFKNNLDKSNLVHQNEQINIFIENLKMIEKSNLDILSKLDQEKNEFKIGDLIKVDNEILYIKDIRHDKPSFPSKTKNNVLIFETINLSNPSTYYFNSRDNRIPLRSLEYSKLKNIDYLNHIDYDTIKTFLENNAKYNQIIFSRLILDSSKNEFNLDNTNAIYKLRKTIFYNIDGIEMLKNNVVSSYNYINDFDLFSIKYREKYLDINENNLEDLKQDDLEFGTKTYDSKLKSINNILLSDLDNLYEINKIQRELSDKIFNFEEIEHNLNIN